MTAWRRAWPFLLAAALGLATDPASAGAWTLKKGDAQAIATVSYSTATQRYDSAGVPRRIKDFEKLEIRTFGEYGLTDWATVFTQPEWRWKSLGEAPGEETYGIGRVDLGARLRVWRNDSAVASLQGTVRAPGAQNRLIPANGGDTEWEIDGRLLFGRGFEAFGRHAFTDYQLGYRHRFGDPADELRLDITAGIDVTPKLLAMVQSFNTVSIGTPRGGFQRTTEYKLSGSLVYRVDDSWSLQAGLFATVFGTNALLERGGLLSVWRSF